MKQRFKLLLLLAISATGCTQGEDVILLGEAADCNAAKETCSVSAGEDIALSLALGPEVKPLEPFPVVLDVQGLQVEPQSLIADFQMRGMDMGINRYRLKKVGERWVSEVTLPVCTTSRMDWFATVEFSAHGQRYQALFPFETNSN